MGKLEESLIAKAIRKHKNILPCRGKSFDASFTEERGRLLFWFNTRDKSTHVVSARILHGKPGRIKARN